MFTNGIVAIAALGLAGIGGWMFNTDFITSTGETCAMFVLVTGLTIFVIAFIGFYSSLRNSVCGLAVFAALHIIIICGMMASAIFVFADDKSIETFLGDIWMELSDESQEILQNEFNCCGWNADISGTNCPEDIAYDTYCWNAIKEDVKSEQDAVVYVALGVLAFELLILQFSCSFRSQLKVIAENDDYMKGDKDFTY